MKKCPYCGREYPDDATSCVIDGELLPDNVSQLAVTEERLINVKSRKDEPYLTFPDYKWSAKDAWKCVGMIIVAGIVFWTIIFTFEWGFPAFRNWRSSGFGHFSMRVLSYGIELLVAAYFARTETLATFWKGFGLDRKPSDYVWFGITLALAIRFFGHFIIIHGWSKGVSTSGFYGFSHTIGIERYFFLLPLLILAPLFEESIYRGFLFTAFRKSYPLVESVILIIAWTAYTHWPQYSHSWIAAFDLSALTIVQCYLREKSDSLWDCVLCHFVFNASSLLFFSASLR